MSSFPSLLSSPPTFSSSSSPPLPVQVFLRESLEHRLEKEREEEVLRAAMTIQAHVLGFIARYRPRSPPHQHNQRVALFPRANYLAKNGQRGMSSILSEAFD